MARVTKGRDLLRGLSQCVGQHGYEVAGPFGGDDPADEIVLCVRARRRRQRDDWSDLADGFGWTFRSSGPGHRAGGEEGGPHRDAGPA